MLFNSPLFLFPPVFGLVYALTPSRWANTVLLAASTFFYAWIEPSFAVVVLFSSALDYLMGIQLRRSTNDCGEAVDRLEKAKENTLREKLAALRARYMVSWPDRTLFPL